MFTKKFYCLTLADSEFFTSDFFSKQKWYIEGSGTHWMIKDKPLLQYDKRADVDIQTDREVFEKDAERLKERALRWNKVLYAATHNAATHKGAAKKVSYENHANLWTYRPTLAESQSYNNDLHTNATKIIEDLIEQAYTSEPNLDRTQRPLRDNCAHDSHYETLIHQYVHALSKAGYINRKSHDELFFLTKEIYMTHFDNTPSIDIRKINTP